MRLRVFTRLLAAAATVLLAAASAPALAQTADVSVAFSLNGETDADGLPTPRTAGLTYGGSETYKVVVTNNGPSHVTSFVLDGTFTPPGAPYNLPIAVTAPAGCVKTGTTPLPCTMSFDPPLVSGATSTMTIGIKVPLPDPPAPGDPIPLPTAPADCPGAGTTVTAHIEVPAATVLQGTTAVDGTPGNNTPADIVTPIRPWADLEVTSVTAPGNANEGQELLYSVVLHNNGPCAATNVFSDFLPPSTVTFVSATGCDNDSAFGPADDAGCDLSSADIAVGADRSYEARFTVNTFPSEIIRAAVPVDVEANSTSPDGATPQDHIPAVDDPDSSNNAGSASTTIDLSDNEGCSTGGAGTLFGLLSLVALRFGRRRSA